MVGPLIKRVIIFSVISVIAVLGVSELSYRILSQQPARSPEIVEIVIPMGTGDRIQAGESVSDIAGEMVFMVGDTLVLHNQDLVDHQLGPLWIPAGGSASMELNMATSYAYSCSFQPSKYLDLTIREPITWRSRLGAVLYGAPPTLMFLLVYSFAVRPLKSDDKNQPIISGSPDEKSP